MNLIYCKKNNLEHEENFSNRIIGFWFYLLSDFIIFGVLFTVYVIMRFNFNNLVDFNKIFNPYIVFFETILLLFSSFSYGIFLVFLKKFSSKIHCVLLLCITFFLGISFVFLEFYEFYNLYFLGFSPFINGFFSAFFTLLGVHGLHVICGLIWILVMLFHFYHNGFSKININRFICLGLFWHLLDIVWIFLYNFIYLIGVI
ncbi:Cytochrome O ubiquinol oxidase subunit III [Candidatus Purcelliella pentastirinorum]|uniref:Cytochrome bo(3) ubiquinol oxidase subunit 3 n=1 Tax=Candidatus Purcelliella pentastirinorum TaxID=472834 RepID=A0A346E098_9ENTR|nr:cytochrome c oxidase subunit 3 [Candidatus Purcelliella pentastirinorum]AXN02403.1 Cytochrome O ubiquinol oxidase subunit III [Candidatus Purcelliella pentastirinorum]